METVNLSKLIELVQQSVGIAGIAGQVADQNTGGVLHPAYREAIIRVAESLANLEPECELLNLPMSKIAVRRAITEIKAIYALSSKGNASYVNSATVTVEVNIALRTLMDEASLRLYFHLPEESRILYDNRRPFGDSVWSAFSDAIYDAEEAAKCLALGRATASVFHSMRVMEFGLRALISDSFGDPEFLKDVQTWGAITNRVRREANQPDHKIAAAWRGKQDRLMKLALMVAQVADAFRNPTVHCASIYTVEQSRDVFQATGAFMRRLAEDFSDGKDPENQDGPRDTDADASGVSREPEKGRKTQAEITPPKQREEGLGTSAPPRDAGCTARRTRSGRTEDA